MPAPGTPPASAADDGGSGRIGVLDVLRGIALLGMFLVHFNDFSTEGSGPAAVYQTIVGLFMSERFWTIFGILFGAGFAIQLRRADARGAPFVRPYLRRALGLAGFGVVAHAGFGFNVLLAYAGWGAALLLVRRWSVGALLVAVILSASSMSVYGIARMGWGVATRGETAVREEGRRRAEEVRAFHQANREAQDARSYPAVVAARLDHMRWFYAQPFSFLPVNNFTLLLLGVLAMRLGLFEDPGRHRRLIVGLMAFGVLSWASAEWLLPGFPPELGSPMLPELIRLRLLNGFGLIRPSWLAFTYIGVVLLLVAASPAWLRRLALFGWAGRMALTNYMIQIAVLDLTFSKYALGLSIPPLSGLVAAVGLFLLNAAWSRWWLGQFRYGPLEWLWRSLTHGRWQAWRVAPGAPAGAEGAPA